MDPHQPCYLMWDGHAILEVWQEAGLIPKTAEDAFPSPLPLPLALSRLGKLLGSDREMVLYLDATRD